MDYLENKKLEYGEYPMPENEIWKTIDGYEDYEISNKGNVRSHKRGKIKIMHPCIINKRGYLGVQLIKNKRAKTFQIHRLVALSFIPNTNNFPQVNHKDEIKTNNSVENLEWCTNQYNLNYGTRLEKLSKKMGKTILQYDLNGNFIKKWNGCIKASKSLKINEGNIWECCNHKRKTAGKFLWKYEWED